MATELNRLTFAVTKEMEPLLKQVKKRIFYDRNQSEMIRELVMAGLKVLNENQITKKEE